MFTDLFHLDMPILEKVLRTLIVYAFLIAGLRLAGKRELAQLNPFDLVVLLTLSNALQNAIIGNDNSLLGGLIGAATLLIVNHFVVRFSFDHEKMDRLVEGTATVLIDQGKIQQDQLKAELLTLPELEIAAHRQGIGSLSEVEKATLETGGTISFILKKPAPDLIRHNELLERLDRMSKELAELRAAISKP